MEIMRPLSFMKDGNCTIEEIVHEELIVACTNGCISSCPWSCSSVFVGLKLLSSKPCTSTQVSTNQRKKKGFATNFIKGAPVFL